MDRLQFFLIDVQVLVQKERVLGELESTLHVYFIKVDKQRLVVIFGGERRQVDHPSAIDRQRKAIWKERTCDEAMSSVLDQTVTVLVMIAQREQTGLVGPFFVRDRSLNLVG